MSSNLATLAFRPLADALMAGLASRAHQWTSWEMLQYESFEIEWGEKSPARIFQGSGRIELRVFGPDSAILSSSTSTQVSASSILNTLLLEKSTIGRCYLLQSSPPPSVEGKALSIGAHILKIQTLDNNTTQVDPWTLPLERWNSEMPQRPSRIEDLRYRNSLGFVGLGLFQTFS